MDNHAFTEKKLRRRKIYLNMQNDEPASKANAYTRFYRKQFAPPLV